MIVKLHGTTNANEADGPADVDVRTNSPSSLRTARAEAQGRPAGDRWPTRRAAGGHDDHGTDAVERRSRRTLGHGTGHQTQATSRTSNSTSTRRAPRRCRSARPSTRARRGQARPPPAHTPSFSLTFGREDREQDLSGVQVHMPLGLVGKIAGIHACGEAEIQAAESNSGECPAESEIGTADAGAGPGPDPFFDDRARLLHRSHDAQNGRTDRSAWSVVTPAERRPVQPRQRRRPLGDQHRSAHRGGDGHLRPPAAVHGRRAAEAARRST